MSRAPSNFRQQDVTRAINAAKASGLPIARVEIDAKTAKITVFVGEPNLEAPTPANAPNPWEEEAEEMKRRRLKRCGHD